MNIINKIFSTFKNIKKETILEPTNILANGLSDRKDIEDPTSKFFGPIHVGMEYNKSNVRRKDIIYRPSEYDLPMLANAVQLDGLLRRVVNLYTEQILKNSYELNSQNDKIQRHVYFRIKEVQNFTGISFMELLSQICTQLVTYGNAYVIKVREKDTSKFGKSYRLYGRECNPIVGLFMADASTMEVGLNPRGDLATYKQCIRGESIEWDERDVIHFTYNKIPGTLTGQSALIPVLDDVRALRKLEEEIEILGFQYSIPLYLYKVGNKDIPAAPGEIENISANIANMPNYGMLVIPGHHDVTVPSNSSSVMDIIKYVDHFKTRIFGGLGVSAVAMGQSDTSNRNTAQVADLAMQSITKSYQQIIKNKLELDLFREYMLDGGYQNIKDEIEFKFPEIDIETQIKKETHIIAKWQNNLITRTEGRNEMAYETKIDDGDTFLRIVDIPKIEAQKKAQLEVAQLNADTTLQAQEINAKNALKMAKIKGTQSSGSGSSANPISGLPKPSGSGATSITKIHHKITIPKKSKNEKATSNKSAPANQHGKSTRPKFVKNSQDNIFNGLTIFNKIEFSDKLFSNISDYLKELLDLEVKKLCDFYHKDNFVYDISIIDCYFSGLKLLVEDKVSRAVRFLDDIDKIDLLNMQIKTFLDDQENKIHNLAKILMFKHLGKETILIISANCEEHADTTFEISKMDYSKLPPFGYKCKCEIDEENLNE